MSIHESYRVIVYSSLLYYQAYPSMLVHLVLKLSELFVFLSGSENINPPSCWRCHAAMAPSQRDPVGSVGLLQLADADGIRHHLQVRRFNRRPLRNVKKGTNRFLKW